MSMNWKTCGRTYKRIAEREYSTDVMSDASSPISAEEKEGMVSALSTVYKGREMSAANDHIAKSVVDLLLKSHIVAVPTDTIYGLAGLAQDNWSVRSIYHAKRRDVAKPLAICVGEIEDIPKWAVVTVPKSLLDDLLPGPVTLVFERTPQLNPNFNPDTNLVGVRIPNNSFIRKVARGVGQPIALTSANYSNANSALTINEFKDLWPFLRLVVDGGLLGESEESRFGSTVVDLSIVGHYKIIRNGCAYENTTKILQDKYNLKPIINS